MKNVDFQVGKTKVRFLRGDITDMPTDAIVNAANSSLLGGGGVDGAIHRKGGSKILDECIEIRKTKWPDGLPAGKAVLTNGGNLKAKFVIHTVGPVWRGGKQQEPEILANAYENSLRTAVAKGLRSISFPSISTGAYGYPVAEASRIALKTVKKFLEKEDSLDEVIFVLFSDRDLEIYQGTATELSQ